MSFSDKVLQLKQDFDDVYEASRKEVWKGITNNGTRVQYSNGFYYWNLDYFYPCYDMQPVNAGYMFASTTNAIPIDLVERLEQCGVTLDFSQCTVMPRTFYSSDVSRIGTIDVRKSTALERTFASPYVRIIDKIIVKAENTFSYTFESSRELVEVRFEGEIGNNIDFSVCTKLSHDSLMSIINHLESKTSGTFTLTIGATNLAKLTDTEKAVATQKGWTIA